MSMIPVALFLGGEIISNFETLGAVTERVWTVPLGRKWWLLFGRAERDVNATLDIQIRDVNTVDILTNFTQLAAGVTTINWPKGLSAGEQRMWETPIILGGGQQFRIIWGVAQTTPEVVMQVLEF